jgi:alkanesulfonate monooxygenase SsuD/methylene tetrahydromethanopterin reductase-like flavin-dependent oxidoreductase (luciferase family)
MVAIIGGEPHRYRPLIDLYREAGREAGHPDEALKVGLHVLGHVALGQGRAADEFYPGYARTFTAIGKERGWPAVTRAHYDALLDAKGALFVGEPEAVADKIFAVSQALGGISRLSFQMSPGTLPHAQALRGIELIGTGVIPLVRRESEVAGGPEAK